MPPKLPKILVVDDDMDFIRLMDLNLSKRAKPVFAFDRKRALDILSRRAVDIALVDIRLGADDGIRLAREIKKKYPEIMVYLITGSLIALRWEIVDIQCIEKTTKVDLMVDQIMNFWDLNVLGEYQRRKREAILSRLPCKDKVKVVFRREGVNLEVLTGVIPDEAMPRYPHYLRWVVYRYPQHPGVIDIGVSPTEGCSGRCRMCLSGRNRPLRMNFTPMEIMAQVLNALDSVHARGYLSDNNLEISVNWTCEGEFTDNVVNSCIAIEELLELSRLDLGIRFKFIITTIGKEKGLREFMEHWMHLPVDFYWSVHTVDPAKRTWLMPGTAGQSLEATRDIFSEFAHRTGRRVTAACSLAKGFNDSLADMRAWIDFFRGFPFDTKIQKISSHCLPDYPLSVTDLEARRLVDLLISQGVPARLRDIMGTDILGGCGRTVPDFDYFIVGTKAYEELAHEYREDR